MRLSRGWRWIASISPGGAQWIQSPCKLPPSLARLISQSRTPSARSDNRARNSNDRSQEPDGPPASSAADGAPPRLRAAPFLFEEQLDRRCGTSNHRSKPIQQTPLQSSDRVPSLFEKVVQPFLYRREICPVELTNRVPVQTRDRLRHFASVCAQFALSPLAKASLAIRERSVGPGLFEWQTHRSDHGHNLPPTCARLYRR